MPYIEERISKAEDRIDRLERIVEEFSESIGKEFNKLCNLIYESRVDVEFDALRVKKRHISEKGRIREFDFILVCNKA
ncbi:MAG: hypothetical protein N2Z80_00580 [Hydrogenothermaceae bacterium]|nr:hypothetical protein [Hydrogenothermaceae bacterium]